MDFIIRNKSLLKIQVTTLFCAVVIFSINSFAMDDYGKSGHIASQDTFIVKPDSLLNQTRSIPPVIVFKDITIKSPFSSFLDMSKFNLNQHFEEDLGTFFEYIPGIFIFDRGSSGQELGFGRHGTKANQTSVFLDGRPLYDPIYGGIDLNFIPSRFIRSMTMEQGICSPLSLIHGEMVSLATEHFNEDAPYSQVGYHKAGLGFSDVDIIFGQQATRKINFLLGGIIKSFNGQSEAYNSDLQNFRGKVQYFYSPNWLLEYSWIHNKLTRRAPGPVLENSDYATPEAVEKNSRLDQTLSFKGKIFNAETPNFFASIYHSAMNRSLTDPDFDLASNNDGNYAGLNVQISDTLLGQAWTGGANFSQNWANSDDVGKQSTSQGSFYVQDDLNWQEKMGIRLLGTYQFFSSQGSSLLGGLSGYLQFNNLKLIGAVKNSVHHPTMFQLFANTNYIDKKSLDSEKHQKFSFGLNWQPNPKMEIKSEVYLKNIIHPIYFQSVDTVKATFTNFADFHFIGGDFHFKWIFSNKFQLAGILSGIKSNTWTNYPQFSVISYLQYSDSFFENDLNPTVRIEARYFGERQSNIYHPYYFISPYQTLAPAFLLNAHALLDFGNLKMYFTFENIFDADYQMLYGYPMNGRTLHYGLRWEFWD